MKWKTFHLLSLSNGQGVVELSLVENKPILFQGKSCQARWFRPSPSSEQDHFLWAFPSTFFRRGCPDYSFSKHILCPLLSSLDLKNGMTHRKIFIIQQYKILNKLEQSTCNFIFKVSPTVTPWYQIHFTRWCEKSVQRKISTHFSLQILPCRESTNSHQVGV